MKFKSVAIAALTGIFSLSDPVFSQEKGLEDKVNDEELNPRKEVIRRMYTQSEARTILSNPEKFKYEASPEQFKADYEHAKKTSESHADLIMPRLNSHDFACELLDKIREDNDFLKKLVVLYLPLVQESDKESAAIHSSYIPAEAIKRMPPGDDSYFKNLFEKGDYSVKKEVLIKMSDSAKIPLIEKGLGEYGKHTLIVEKHHKEFHYFESNNYSAAVDALMSVNDKIFLETVSKRTDIGKDAIDVASQRLAEMKEK